jgi:hypothetical protein
MINVHAGQSSATGGRDLAMASYRLVQSLMMTLVEKKTIISVAERAIIVERATQNLLPRGPGFAAPAGGCVARRPV